MKTKVAMQAAKEARQRALIALQSAEYDEAADQLWEAHKLETLALRQMDTANMKQVLGYRGH